MSGCPFMSEAERSLPLTAVKLEGLCSGLASAAMSRLPLGNGAGATTDMVAEAARRRGSFLPFLPFRLMIIDGDGADCSCDATLSGGGRESGRTANNATKGEKKIKNK